MNGKKNGGVIGVIIVLAIAIIIGLSCCSSGTGGGNGKSTCRNCGRKKPLSAYGYCSTCQKGFNEWQDKNYRDKHYVND